MDILGKREELRRASTTNHSAAMPISFIIGVTLESISATPALARGVDVQNTQAAQPSRLSEQSPSCTHANQRRISVEK